MSATDHHSGLAAFRHLDFSLYEIERALIVTALEMLSVAVGWQVYEITRRPLDLGFVGLAQFLPNIFLFLIAGHTADRLSGTTLEQGRTHLPHRLGSQRSRSSGWSRSSAPP